MTITLSQFKNTKTRIPEPKEFETWEAAREWLLAGPIISETKEAAPLWCPATFRVPLRRSENVQSLALAAWDFEGLPVEEMRALLQRITDSGLEGCFYTSHSHGTEKKGCAGRLVLLPIEPIPVTEHLRVWTRVPEILKFEPDQATKDPARIYYRFSAHPARKDGAVCRRFEGKPLDWRSLPALTMTPTKPKTEEADDAGQLEGGAAMFAGLDARKFAANIQKRHPREFVSVERGGAGRDGGVYMAACAARDMALSEEQATEQIWKARHIFDPPLTEQDWNEGYRETISSAYLYAQNAPGAVRAARQAAVASPYRSVLDAADPDEGRVTKETKIRHLSDGRPMPCKPERQWNAAELADLLFSPLRGKFVQLIGPGGEPRVFAVNDRREVLELKDLTQVETVMSQSLEGFQLHRETTRKAVQQWLRERPDLIDYEPAPLSLEPPTPDAKLVYSRPDIRLEAGPFPAWTEFLDRLTYADGFKAAIWAIFESRARSRQVLWLRGMKGEDGKSQVLSTLAQFIGVRVYWPLRDTDFKNEAAQRFAASNIEGKALAGYADAKVPSILATELLRNITGRDYVASEAKGKDGHVALLPARVIVCSNLSPELDNTAASTSRCLLIFVTTAPEAKRTVDWGDRLRAEMGPFLFACREAYQRLCPTHGNIPITEEMVEEQERLQQNHGAEFEEVVALGVIDRGGLLEASKLKQWALTAWKLAHVPNQKIAELKDYLRVRYGVIEVKHQPSRRLYYRGIREPRSRMPPGTMITETGAVRDAPTIEEMRAESGWAPHVVLTAEDLPLTPNPKLFARIQEIGP